MRKKTPTRVLDARGAFRKHPERRREGEPLVTEPIGATPDCLEPDEAKSWQEIVERAPVGVLTEADRISAELAACLLAEYRRDRGAMNAARLARLHSLLGCFGMNPADRASLSIPKPAEPNPFEDLDS